MGTKHLGPEPTITFARAMRLFLVAAQPDKISTVRHCPTHRFSGLVKHAAKTATAADPEKCWGELEECDYSSLPDRWYAICVLIEFGCEAFWAESWVDARVLDEERMALK